MNTLRILCGIAVCLLFTNPTEAQEISTRYSDTEITAMLDGFQATNGRDIAPTETLRRKFNADFPLAYEVEWSSSTNIYEVVFKLKRRSNRVYYDTKGNLLMIIQEIHSSELPAAVKNAVMSKYPKCKLDDVDKIRRGTEVLYNVEIELDGREIKLSVRNSGEILS
jgi:hypothetical protein